MNPDLAHLARPRPPFRGEVHHNLAPALIGGEVVLGAQGDDLFTMPTSGAGRGARLPHLNPYELERNADRRRVARKTTCPTCGAPTWTGPDDTPSGAMTAIVTLDRGRLTRLGMYQAATGGRRIYTLRREKAGQSIDWLGDVAQPQPERDHLLVAHSCELPDLDTAPEPPPAAPDGPPPF